MLVAFLVVFRALQRSHIGWAFRALRDNELAAELAGVDVARYRVYAGLIGSAMLGLTGAVFAHSDGFISPSTFEFGHVDVRVLVMLAFGGLGTLLGPVVGTVVFAVLDELLIDFGQLRTVVYGLLVIALFLGFKRGAVPAVTDFLRLLVRRVPPRVRRPP
jgi:ABC-type branched-subunit amino acid transport system permease subunit